MRFSVYRFSALIWVYRRWEGGGNRVGVEGWILE